MEILMRYSFKIIRILIILIRESLTGIASRLENNPRYLNKLSFLSDSEKLSKASHKSCRISIHQPKSSETRVSEQICLRCEIRQSICGQTAKKGLKSMKSCKIYVKLSIISRNPKENVIYLNISDSLGEMQSLINIMKILMILKLYLNKNFHVTE